MIMDRRRSDQRTRPAQSDIVNRLREQTILLRYYRVRTTVFGDRRSDERQSTGSEKNGRKKSERGKRSNGVTAAAIINVRTAVVNKDPSGVHCADDACVPVRVCAVGPGGGFGGVWWVGENRRR